MRTTAGRSLLAALAAALLIPVQAEAQVPPDAVALVGTQPITRATFDHWFRVAATEAGSKRLPKRGTAYRGFRDQTMQYLISAAWIEGEAALQGITVTSAEVDTELAADRRASYPRRKDFEKFLRDSGMRLADLKLRVRVQLLSDRLRERVWAGAQPVTDAEVAAYYAAHLSRFRVPARRDLRIVQTRFGWRARRALELLRAGMPWRRVARLLSIDARSRKHGGLAPGFVRGGNERRLDRAIFSAPLHQLRGPIHIRSGYFVFEVARIHPARQLSMAEATPTVRQLLKSEREQAVLDDFVRDFQQRWRSVTVCRSGFITLDCSNARL